MPIDKVLSGYHRFKEKFASERDVFVRLAEEGQNPKVLWIGCSDSRIIPEQITGAEAGKMFVMRNIANVVPPSDTTDNAVGAVIEYAVLHLGVPHIVICGHTECGGIKALERDIDIAREPHIARWIELARPARVRVERSGIPKEKWYPETIKANVLLQRENIQTYSCVREAVSDGKLIIHAWLHDLRTGDLFAYDDKSGGWTLL